ncbi:hypothetical protein [Actinoplanes sp. NPDC026670]|uniref:hypothetical protein n=1 Tax=Actinoplanes sp. NPDC026670 TaxID=3154700 RepID=UPI0033E15E9C
MTIARSPRPVMLRIDVELVKGCGRAFWPRPGRVVNAHPANTFAELAQAIDLSFGRTDLGHLRLFALPGGVEVSWTEWRDGPAFAGTADGRTCGLDTLRPGDSFTYMFDLGQDWTHLCRVTAGGGR